MTHCKTDLSS